MPLVQAEKWGMLLYVDLCLCTWGLGFYLRLRRRDFGGSLQLGPVSVYLWRDDGGEAPVLSAGS